MKKLWISAFIFSLLLVSCHCSVSVSADSTIWYDSSFLYRNVYFVDSDLVDEALSDFPVLIYLNGSYVNWSRVNDDLSDLRFVSSSNVLLSHEIDKSTLNDEAWIWVKLPSISSVVDTKLFMYYGYPAASTAENKTDVWNNSFVGVWHMNDNSTSTILDSTSNDNDGVKKGANEPSETDGKIGYGQYFDGDDDYVLVSSVAPSQPLTFEFLFNASTLDNGFCVEVSYGRIKLRIVSNKISATYYTGSWNYLDGGSFVANSFYHVVFTKNSSGACVYVNKTLMEFDSVSDDLIYADSNVYFGSDVGIGDFWQGVLDEIRIGDIDFSSAWVGASYETQILNLISLFEIEGFVDTTVYAKKGEIIAAAVVAILIFVPLSIFLLHVIRKRR